ncbi:hypothetical protein PYW07_017521 [Mythimna separata]|uniref:Uncharacterized protein n=1 Tax=Mythimna separata TaxID=271217 RepID=A0AAD7Y5K2_MYTSE|nr:hypothetical protein PYW07_017521 [Mythimna separata]
MATMEDLLATQQQLIEGIDRLYSNFKKDGAERKTHDYLRRRLESLEQYFTEFHNNHMNLLSFGDRSHAYFTTDQYDKTKSKYSNIKTAIQNYKPSTDRPQTPILKPPAFQPSSISQTPTVSCQNNPPKDSVNIEDLLKKQATNFRAFSREASDIDLNLISEMWEFEDILKTLKTRWTAIDTLHWELDNELNGSNAKYDEQFSNYEKYYKTLKRDINRKMWSMAHVEKSTLKMEIATFEGSYTSWISFKDLFTETVHKNPTLSNAQKMQFLKSKIKGEPEKLIQHLQISSDNYPVCWNILTHRYDNKRRIFISSQKPPKYPDISAKISEPPQTDPRYNVRKRKRYKKSRNRCIYLGSLPRMYPSGEIRLRNQRRLYRFVEISERVASIGRISSVSGE